MKKYLFIFCTLCMIMSSLAGCSNDTNEELQSIIDNITPINPSDKLAINTEELMKRADVTGSLTCYTIGYVFDTSVTSTAVTFKNDGEKYFFRQDIENKVTTDVSNPSLSLQGITKTYYSYPDNAKFTQQYGIDETFTKCTYEFKKAPNELTIKTFLEQEIGPGFWDAFLASFASAEYDVVNDEYHIGDFSIMVGNETRAFDDVIVKFHGTQLSLMKSKSGPQTFTMEFSDLTHTTIILPTNTSE